METNKDLTQVDCAILSLLKEGEITQADLVKRLLRITGEGYVYSRVRTLQYRGLLKKEEVSAYKTRILTLTPEGLARVTQEDPGKPVPTEGA